MKETKYGVTWATTDHTIAQTGYVFATVKGAETAARRGPAAQAVQVDGMCEHYPDDGGKLFGMIETEDDSVYEVTVEA